MEKINLRNLLERTIKREGTDLHICPGAAPFIRVNGELEVLDIPPLDAAAVKNITDEAITVEQKRALQETKVMAFSFSINGLGRFRACVYSQRGTFAITIRILPFGVPDFQKIGLPDITGFAALDKGLVLVTGSPGSGKTTTLAALVNLINGLRTCHVTTIENPIEYLHRHSAAFVTQREIGADVPDLRTALSWALKSDADVIVLGEMPRDSDALHQVLSIAEERLVLSCVNSTGALDAINRIIGGGNTARQPGDRESIQKCLSAVLEGVIYQQLQPYIGFAANLKCEIITPDSTLRQNIFDGKIPHDGDVKTP